MQAASLGGLSPEEALLIADVMSRLTGTMTLQEQASDPRNGQCQPMSSTLKLRPCHGDAK